MNIRRQLPFAFCAVLCLTCVAAFGQQVEIHPYAGGFFPSTNNPDIGRFRDEGIYGVKAGVFVTPGLELGGHFGYINHFEIRPGTGFWERLNPSDRSAVRGLLWEATGDYNFNNTHPFGAKVLPYLGIGAGGLTANVRPTANGSRSIELGPGTSILNANGTPGRSLVLDNNDTFFMFSYGGGLKALRLWGPVGLRGEVKGRTIPNIFGHETTWPEVTGGLTFSFGEQ